MRSVLRFLAQCHAKGLIYRDVKPDNFMFLHNVSYLLGVRLDAATLKGLMEARQ